MHCMDKQTYLSNKNFPLQLTFKLAPIIPAFCLLLLHSYYYSNYFTDKIEVSLNIIAAFIFIGCIKQECKCNTQVNIFL